MGSGRVIEKPLTSEEIIAGFEIMDKSITKAMASGNTDDLYDFHFVSEELSQKIPAFKGHCHLPEHLVYLKTYFNYSPQYDYQTTRGGRYAIVDNKRINDNF